MTVLFINVPTKIINYFFKLIIHFLLYVQFFNNPYMSNEEILIKKMNGIGNRQTKKPISDSITQVEIDEKFEEMNGGHHDHKTTDVIPKQAVSPFQSNSRFNEDVNMVIGDEVIDDPFCRADDPKTISFADITSAAFKIRNGIIETPCQRSKLSELTGMEIYFKKDFLQSTGSFKERGACYSLLMLSEESKKTGVITASLGNHALALCYHGKRLKIPVTVIMPILAPIMKVAACRKLDANVVVAGSDMKESKYLAMKMGKDKGLTYINGYDHPHIIAGQGTLGLEIVEQVDNIDAIIVPVGGAGLIAGVALAVKTLHPNVKIIGVESERCPSYTKALKAGTPISVPISSTLADGLAVPMVGYNAFATALPLVDEVIVLKEEWIAIAILRLIELEKCVVEGAGATGLAAILAGHLTQFKGKRVVIPLCGGNIDTTILGRCLDRGLAADGRLLKFSVMISDRPGGISELCKLLADMGVSIKDILHERAWITSDVFSVKVKVVCETRDMDHTNELKTVLNKTYRTVSFGDIPKFPLLGIEFDELDK